MVGAPWALEARRLWQSFSYLPTETPWGMEAFLGVAPSLSCAFSLGWAAPLCFPEPSHLFSVLQINPNLIQAPSSLVPPGSTWACAAPCGWYHCLGFALSISITTLSNSTPTAHTSFPFFHSRPSTTKAYFPLKYLFLLAKSLTLAKLVHLFSPNIWPTAFIPFLTWLKIPLSLRSTKLPMALLITRTYFPLSVSFSSLSTTHSPSPIYSLHSCNILKCIFLTKVIFIAKDPLMCRATCRTCSSLLTAIPIGSHPQLFGVHPSRCFSKYVYLQTFGEGLEYKWAYHI